MWIVLIGLLLHLAFSSNAILFLVNIVVGIVLLLANSSLMSDNIEYLYLFSSILYSLHVTTHKRIFAVVKLISDLGIYIFGATIMDQNWILLAPVIVDVMQLMLIRV